MRLYVIAIFLGSTTCLALPGLQNRMDNLSNNSYIFSGSISRDESALKCVTSASIDCCNDASVGNWRDVRGSPVQEGRDRNSCLYVTRGDGEISLNRKSGCLTTHQDCRDVIFLTPVDTIRASTSTLALMNHMVKYYNYIVCIIDCAF